jgi:protocatechuate 3,4-dioxygenase beta subunit
MADTVFVDRPVTLTERTGPVFPIRLTEAPTIDLTELRGKSARGVRITLSGQILEHDGRPVKNAIVEIWQPDAEGLFNHPADPRAASADPNFLGCGQCVTDGNGWYRFRTIMPGRRADDGSARLPHINLMLRAPGIMRRLTTTVFFSDDPDNADDPVLSAVPRASRGRVFARRAPEWDRMTDEAYRFDVVIQGVDETPFFVD